MEAPLVAGLFSAALPALERLLDKVIPDLEATARAMLDRVAEGRKRCFSGGAKDGPAGRPHASRHQQGGGRTRQHLCGGLAAVHRLGSCSPYLLLP